jgi:hypothetical protein
MQLVATAASDAFARAVHIADTERVRALLQSTDVDPNKQVHVIFCMITHAANLVDTTRGEYNERQLHTIMSVNLSLPVVGSMQMVEAQSCCVDWIHR